MATANLLPDVQAFLQKPHQDLFIDGQFVAPSSGQYVATVNPATGEVLTRIASGNKADVDAAVRAARNAMEGPWARLHPAERAGLLHKLADLLEARQGDFAQLETLDSGKPIGEAMEEDVPLSIDLFRYYADWATKLTGETLPVSTPGNVMAYTRREPLGVVGLITPWNFPLQMVCLKAAAALACGNTVVVKPAELTSLTALRLAQLFAEVGFPEGVFNVVTGSGSEVGAALAAHDGVDKISFTGGTETGRKIVQASAGNLKKVSLELGGKSPNIVFDDVPDMDAAVEAAFWAIFFNQGEICGAGSRLLLQRSIYDQFVAKLVKMTETIRLGNGLDPETTMGPLISEQHRAQVEEYIESAAADGAQLIARCGELPDKGFFVRPAIFGEVPCQARIAKEEIFGPVLSVIPFEDEAEALQIANDTIYGLAAGVWTSDMSRGHRLAHAIQAGTVWLNTYNLFDVAAPWGGMKQSGYGREYSRHALDEYTQVKTVWVNI